MMWRRRRRPPGRWGAPAWWGARLQAAGPLSGPQVTITLDVVVSDSDGPAIQRLVRDAASRVFRTSPDVQAAIVEDRAGKRLGMVERDQTLSEPMPGGVPESGPGGSSASGGEPVTVGREGDQDRSSHRSLADHFEFPDAVRAHLRQPNDPVDIVRAILEAAELPVEVHGNVMRSGDQAVIVLSEAGGSPSEVLADAFLRFQKSGASHGVVITHGYVGGRDVERREALAPNLRYVGLSAIQRMADAVAVGANPLRFAAEPAVLE